MIFISISQIVDPIKGSQWHIYIKLNTQKANKSLFYPWSQRYCYKNIKYCHTANVSFLHLNSYIYVLRKHELSIMTILYELAIRLGYPKRLCYYTLNIWLAICSLQLSVNSYVPEKDLRGEGFLFLAYSCNIFLCCLDGEI